MTLEEQRACMAPLQLAGLIIMENGGETFRVEETVTRMGRSFGLREVETFAVPSGLFISYQLSDGTAESSVKRVRPGSTHLIRVDQVNSISREMENHPLSPDEALARLEKIRGGSEHQKLLPLGAAICAGGFTLMFGGGVVEVIVSFLTAALVQALSQGLARLRLQTLFSTLTGSILAALIPMLLSLLRPALGVESVIAGALMPMLPGLTMTHAVQDTMRGDMVSGLSHGVQALLVAGLVAGGALAADAIFRLITGGVF